MEWFKIIEKNPPLNVPVLGATKDARTFSGKFSKDIDGNFIFSDSMGVVSEIEYFANGTQEEWKADFVIEKGTLTKYKGISYKYAVIPAGVNVIGRNAFRGCRLTEIVMPDTVERIQMEAFQRSSSLVSIRLSRRLLSIGERAFFDCTSLKDIELPTCLEKIGIKAFENCKSLTAITIPRSALKVNNYAFSGCESMRRINVLCYFTSLDDYALSYCSKAMVAVRNHGFRMDYFMKKLAEHHNCYFGDLDDNGNREGNGKYTCCAKIQSIGETYFDYDGEWKNDTMNGKGTAQYYRNHRSAYYTHTVEHGSYHGDWVDGKRQGHGIYEYSGGDRYEGEWLNDQRHGKGFYHYGFSGDGFDGTFKDGNEHGKGTYYFANGDRYEATWENGDIVGDIVMYLANGDRYEGELKYENGKYDFSGGVYYYAGGEVYIGEWSDGKRNGKGTLHLKNGNKYTGNWENDKAHGKGAVHYPNGDRYETTFENGSEVGTGTYCYANGDRYIGEWQNNEKHGKGTLTLANGDRYEGDFANDKYHGFGKLSRADGKVFIGEWVNGELDGKCRVQSRNSKFDGYFKNGKANGWGKLEFSNGDRYEGEFKDGTMHGEGTYYYSDGRKDVGTWEKGKFVRPGEARTLESAGSHCDKYVFISYSTKNLDFANAALHLLKSEGISTWIAPNDIPAGSRYAYVINDAIKNSACVLLLLSEHSQSSEWVDREIERAINYKKTIISMHIDDCELNAGFSFYLGSQQIVPVRSINKDDPDVKRVLKSIKVCIEE